MARLNSKFACEWSVGRLTDPHLWTFTFPVVLVPRDAAKRWSLLQRDLVRSLGMYGVRVFEPHPGGHGLHVHLVVSGRYEVNAVRPLALKHGFGRINVIRCAHPEYVAKYLTKSHREDGWSWRGLRLWAAIGKSLFPVAPTRVCDVVHSSPVRALYERFKRVLCGVSDYREARLLYTACEWYLAGLMTCGVLVDGRTGYHVGFQFVPSFPSRQLARCVFVRRRVATPPAREEDGKGDDAAESNLV